MDISIIICSFNRAHNLPECFAFLEKQCDAAQIQWEIILVDNNSTDDTKSFVEAYSKETPLNLRYAFEGEQGLSAARNHGIRKALGKWIIFIDDDIRVSENWLKAIFDTFTQQNCDAVGGRIEVDSPDKLPSWIRPDMYGFLGHQDFGPDPKPLDGISEFPFGGNMAINRHVFDKIGYFDTNMGRKGEGRTAEELFKGEETDFFHRLAKQGGKLYYEPQALVWHKILPHQLTKEFFLTLHRNAGLLKARRDNTSYSRLWFGVPPFLFHQYLRALFKYWMLCLRKGTSFAFRQRMNCLYFRGMIAGFLEK
jgi:glycosyltransferase involved in cell wall biosynthesis